MECIAFRAEVRAKMLEKNKTMKDIGHEINKTEYQVWFILNGYVKGWKDYEQQIRSFVCQ